MSVIHQFLVDAMGHLNPSDSDLQSKPANLQQSNQGCFSADVI